MIEWTYLQLICISSSASHQMDKNKNLRSLLKLIKFDLQNASLWYTHHRQTLITNTRWIYKSEALNCWSKNIKTKKIRTDKTNSTSKWGHSFAANSIKWFIIMHRQPFWVFDRFSTFQIITFAIFYAFDWINVQKRCQLTPSEYFMMLGHDIHIPVSEALRPQNGWTFSKAIQCCNNKSFVIRIQAIQYKKSMEILFCPCFVSVNQYRLLFANHFRLKFKEFKFDTDWFMEMTFRQDHINFLFPTFRHNNNFWEKFELQARIIIAPNVLSSLHMCTSNVCDVMRCELGLFSCWSEMILNDITNNWKHKSIEWINKCVLSTPNLVHIWNIFRIMTTFQVHIDCLIVFCFCLWCDCYIAIDLQLYIWKEF